MLFANGTEKEQEWERERERDGNKTDRALDCSCKHHSDASIIGSAKKTFVTNAAAATGVQLQLYRNTDTT